MTIRVKLRSTIIIFNIDFKMEIYTMVKLKMVYGRDGANKYIQMEPNSKGIGKTMYPLAGVSLYMLMGLNIKDNFRIKCDMEMVDFNQQIKR